MMTTLGIRIERRHLTVAVSTGLAVTFEHTRHLSSSKVRAEETTRDYLAKVLSQCAPSLIACYAPATPGGLSQRLAQLCEETAHAAKLSFVRLHKADLLSGFSVVPLRTRAQLAERVEALSAEPQASTTPKTLRLLQAEASATALLAELNSLLPPP